MGQLSMFSEEDRLKKLSNLGDNLEKLNIIDWEKFRPIIKTALKKERKSNAGRPPFDEILMFKIIVLQKLYNLSDDRTEFRINDSLSFSRFLQLTMSDKVPDAKTIWLFKETLSQTDAMEKLFSLFEQQLEKENLVTHKGSIVDATFVDAPRQRNTSEENKTIKNGETPEDWKSKPHKLSQKDTDARWTKKNDETHYGYKDHAKVDADSKLITDYAVTAANVHDSNEFTEFFNEKDKAAYADSAYIGQPLPEHVQNQVIERASRNHPLTEEQKANNRIKTKIRVRVEHVFAFMTNSMNGLTIRSIGLRRASFGIGLGNLVYDLFRYAFLKKSKAHAE